MKHLHQNGSLKLALSLGVMPCVMKPIRQPSLTSSRLLRQRALVVSTLSLLLDLSKETHVQPQTALKRMSKVS